MKSKEMNFYDFKKNNDPPHYIIEPKEVNRKEYNGRLYSRSWKNVIDKCHSKKNKDIFFE